MTRGTNLQQSCEVPFGLAVFWFGRGAIGPIHGVPSLLLLLYLILVSPVVEEEGL